MDERIPRGFIAVTVEQSDSTKPISFPSTFQSYSLWCQFFTFIYKIHWNVCLYYCMNWTWSKSGLLWNLLKKTTKKQNVFAVGNHGDRKLSLTELSNRNGWRKEPHLLPQLSRTSTTRHKHKAHGPKYRLRMKRETCKCLSLLVITCTGCN